MHYISAKHWEGNDGTDSLIQIKHWDRFRKRWTMIFFDSNGLVISVIGTESESETFAIAKPQLERVGWTI